VSFFRVSNPVASPFDLPDLGITIGASALNVVLSDQFTTSELVRSADLEGAIINSDLTVEIDYGTGFTGITAVDYTNRDCLAAFLNVFEITNENANEGLVNGGDASGLHDHSSLYYSETELSGAGGAALIGADDTACAPLTGPFSTVQAAIDALCGLFTGFDLDDVYTNDVDGVLNVNGTTKPLEFRSDDLNDVFISRDDGTNVQDFLRADVSADELLLGALADATNPQVDVRVLSDLYVDGNITFVGTITDTTVNNLNVTNAEILLRDGAANGGNGCIKVERGADGPDAALCWDETDDRWKAGLDGSEQTIALLENDEQVEGKWCFGGETTEPNLCLIEKAVPTTNLGAAGEIPIAMLADGILAVYDKSNSRNKWLSVERLNMDFSGRNSPNNKDEYLWVNRVNSMSAGVRLKRNATLVAASVQSAAPGTYTIRVRKNGVVTDLASLAVAAAAGGQLNTYNVDFDAGDQVQVYIESANNIDSPVVDLEFAYRF
jgi:hypothetical protein